MATRIVQLIGCATARFEDVEYTAAGNSHSPEPVLLRQLVAEGRIAPSDIVEIRRGATLCFTPCPVSRWTAIDVSDRAAGGLVVCPAYVGPHAPGHARLAALRSSEV